MSDEPVDLDAELSQLLDKEALKAARRRAGVEKRRAIAARKRELREAARARIKTLPSDHPWWCTRDREFWRLDPVTMEHNPDAQAERCHERVIGKVRIRAWEYEDGRFGRVHTFCVSPAHDAGAESLRAAAADMYAAADMLDKINATEWWHVGR